MLVHSVATESFDGGRNAESVFVSNLAFVHRSISDTVTYRCVA